MLAPSRPPKLLQRLRRALRVHHYSPRTEETYVAWVRRFVRFHGLRHPGEMGRDEIRQFLTALADRAQLSASSQTQALSALIFLYREVLNRDPGSLGDIVRAKQPSRLPVVLTREEVRGLMGSSRGSHVSSVFCSTAADSGSSRRSSSGSRMWTSPAGRSASAGRRGRRTG